LAVRNLLYLAVRNLVAWTPSSAEVA
jgi:hypothetical protein